MKIALALIFALFAQFAYADCPQFYPLGQVVAVPDSVELCNSFYAVKYDTARHEPIISVEKFRSGNHPERLNDFHPDLRLDTATRAEKADYLHSGFDQGHMTPAADSTSAEEMHDTFLLSNMTPQEPTLNRRSWRMLEIHVRQISPDYVVTGAIYQEYPAFIGAHRVPVPIGYYKMIWKDGVTTAWHADNIPNADVRPSTVDEIEQLTGLKFPRYEVN